MEHQKPQLTLEAPPGALRARSPRGYPGFLIWLLLFLQLTILLKLFLFTEASGNRELLPGVDGGSREAALLLEEQGLDSEAARWWEIYLAGHPNDENRASILYRAGKLRMQTSEYEKAAAHFALAEKWASKDGVTLDGDVGLKMVECLRRLGRYGEVGRELTRRSSQDGKADDAPLVTYAGETIYESQLDRLIESQVDERLQMARPGEAPPREEILRSMKSPEQRQRFLQEYLSEELFARKARDEGLDKEQDFLEVLSSMEARLLAQRYIEKELSSIRPSDVDIESFYKAESQLFKVEGSARIVFTKLEADEEASELLNGVSTLDDFRALAETRASGSSVEKTLHETKPDPMLGGLFSELKTWDIGQVSDSPMSFGEDQYLVGLLSKESSRVPPLDEIRERVRAAYIQRKQGEIASEIQAKLFREYDVKILSDGSGR